MLDSSTVKNVRVDARRSKTPRATDTGGLHHSPCHEAGGDLGMPIIPSTAASFPMGDA